MFDRIGGKSWLIKGAIHYHAHTHLRILDKGLIIKGLVDCNNCDVSAFKPAKWYCPKLLLTVP